MDAFYASVEQRDDPSLRGKPVAVGGSPAGRGVVAAASYEARAFGVRSAMPMARAVRLCPHLSIVRPDFQKYRAASQAVFEIFRSVTPRVEPLSLDEAYLDVTENAWGLAARARSGRSASKPTIRERTALTASAGVAPNKFLAKIASGMEEARWPDRHRARARRAVSPEAAGRCAVGCRPGNRPSAARARHRTPGRRPVGRDVGASRGRRQSRRLAAPPRRRDRRSSGRLRSRGEVVWDREHLLEGPDQPRRDPPRGRSDGTR